MRELKFDANLGFKHEAIQAIIDIFAGQKIRQSIFTVSKTIEEIVKLRNEYAPVVPMQEFFRNNVFTDVAKTNARQILKQAGFEEKSIQTI